MKAELSSSQLNALVFLRILIGWHFLYEGLIKLFNPLWTAEGYLAGATGPFQLFFHWLGASDMLALVDVLNITALCLIGLSLTLGFRPKPFIWVGIILLAFYYLAYPPFPGWEIQAPTEGNYFIVNKNLIEIAALGVLLKFPTSTYFGLDNFLSKRMTSSQSN
ncbi:MAG: DoxX family protein [Bacteroidota bacterium]